MLPTVVAISAIVFALLSAAFWIWSALLPPIYPMAYLSSPPQHVVNTIRKHGKLNACAAGFTGLSVLLQALLTYLQMP